MSKKIIWGGIVSGVVMAMLEMMYEGVWGIGLWAPPTVMAATVIRGLQSLVTPVQFMFGPVMLGMMIHLVNSIIFALIFVYFVAPKLNLQNHRVISGAVYGLAIYFVMWFIVLPNIDPVMLKINGAFFAMSHVVFGAILGWFTKSKNQDAVLN